MRTLYFEPQPLKYMCEDPSAPLYKGLENKDLKSYRPDPGEPPNRSEKEEFVDPEDPDVIYFGEKG